MKRRLLANRLPYRAVLLMLLAVQLVLGFQLQAAQAVAPMPASMRTQMSMPVQMSMANAADASAFAAHDRSADHATLTSAATSGDATASTPDCPKHSMPHDCCHANACQCHCVYTPGAIAVPSLANIATSIAVWFLAATQFVAPRIDEFLRPPIA